MDYCAEFGSQRVSPASSTPYTDATQCKKAVKHVKRPMNAFMVWSQMERRAITAVDPTLHNAIISKELGIRWKALTPEQKQPAVLEAERLRLLHLQEFPDYKYRPQKRAQKTTASLSEMKISKAMKATQRGATALSRAILSDLSRQLQVTIDPDFVTTTKKAYKKRKSSVASASVGSSISPSSIRDSLNGDSGTPETPDSYFCPSSSSASPSSSETVLVKVEQQEQDSQIMQSECLSGLIDSPLFLYDSLEDMLQDEAYLDNGWKWDGNLEDLGGDIDFDWVDVASEV